ncbi:hypothetical protein [Alkalihalobacillus sp. TS-13]|uniref:hypothetical protein n=1 Tax=Alkalihalobacillus sp. TS-13 TaxID=2842455 RepID=UPI001C8880E2|nr:hypothetical protein [Alkalihalobacillus sp. TS-13]
MVETNPKEQIKKLRKKSEVGRSAHGLLFKKYQSASNILHGLTLISASIVAILTFADYNDFLVLLKDLSSDMYDLSVGLTASFVFLLTVFEEFLNLNKKAASHESAVKQLTTFIRLADTAEKKEKVSQEDVDKLTTQYTLINENSPLIPDKTFLRSKQKLKRKKYLSETLDSEPFVPLFIVNIFYIIKKSINYLFEKNANKKN